MNIKKGDTVKIIAGKDRSKQGKVLQVIKSARTADSVVVEGLNLRYKHLRPQRQGEQGQKIMFPAPMAVSNVMLVCPKCGKATRLASKELGKTETKHEIRQRLCKKCNNPF